jgi:anti-sigma regulatory factor (Ser/Thr protein kinase)
MAMSEGQRHELPAVPAAVAAARAIVDEAATSLSVTLRDDAALLVSELMSNVVRHGGATAVLTVGLGEGYLTVELHDDGAGRPAMPSGPLDPSVASGRGLRILDRIAAEWGVEDDQDGTGKTVWFRLATDEGTDTVPDQQTMSDKVREDRTVWS